MIKIGLLAPFEGLHRRSGYIALTAMRQAIADAAPTGVTIMPLALDDAADPTQVERAARKLLQDQDVRALVGPYNPALAQQIQPIMATSGLAWWLPFAIPTTEGVVTPGNDWASPLFAAAAEQAVALGSRRLVLAGWTPGWPPLTDEQKQHAFVIPLLSSDQIAVIQSADAVFWLGSPEQGAAYLTELRATAPDVPFLLGPQADGPIFAEYTLISGPVYLLFWLDDGYEQWRMQRTSWPPTAYLTYRATEQAIAYTLGHPWPSNQSWRIQSVVVKGEAP